MREASVWIVTAVLLGLAQQSDGRPLLVNSSVWYTNQTVLNNYYELGVVRMEFNETIYVNGWTYLCSSAGMTCPPLTCQACDWSMQQASGCSNTSCCGPAQAGQPSEIINEWCDSPTPYETLKINEKSSTYTLGIGQTAYFRFFLPEELYCRPVIVVARPYYGSPALLLSTTRAYPNFDNFGWRQNLPQISGGFGTSQLTLCPIIHQQYTAGTYSMAVYGVTSTSFYLEVLVSSDVYPLPPPKESIACADVPKSAFAAASANPSGDPVYCMEDGVERVFTPKDVNPRTNALVTILPFPPGCHTVSYVLNTGSDYSSGSLVCHQSDLTKQLAYGNSLTGRGYPQRDQPVVFSFCTDEPAYVFCNMAISRTLPAYRLIFSTVSQVLRTPVSADIPHASLTSQDGLSAGITVGFGEKAFVCYDMFTYCWYWIAPPLTDPLYLFPLTYKWTQLPEVTVDYQQLYISAGLSEPTGDGKVLVFVFGFSIANIIPITENITRLSVSLITVTNAEGEAPIMPNDGIDVNTVYAEYSPSKYISHISLASIPPFVPPPCNATKYDILESLLRDQVEEMEMENHLEPVLRNKYANDIFNAALVGTTCVNQIASEITQIKENITRIDQTMCRRDLEDDSVAYYADPCCSDYVQLVNCCIPFTTTDFIEQFDNEANVSMCGVPECATSYYEDVSFAFNNVDDSVLGCTSGITDYTAAYGADQAEAIQAQIVYCLDVVGLGSKYKGMACQSDADCVNWTSECLPSSRCAVSSLPQLEDDFFGCYVDKMTASLEKYLKENVLPQSVANFTKDSPEFLSALRTAATVMDCASSDDPFDLQFRTRYIWDSYSLPCKAFSMGLAYPQNYTLMQQLCPPGDCLGTFCPQLTSACITSCTLYGYKYHESHAETCPSESDCSVKDAPGCAGSYCAYCPPDSSEPCISVDGYTQTNCTEGVACEFDDGSVEFGLTEAECLAKSTGCTTDCVGKSCQSVTGMSGVCVDKAATNSTQCSQYGVSHGVTTLWYNGSTCLLPNVTESNCFGTNLTWRSCGMYSVGECTQGLGDQRYLGCYVSLWRPCANQSECEASGMCSDRNWTTIVRSASYPVNVQVGVCMTSGSFTGRIEPSCGRSIRNGIGCLSTTTTSASQCPVLQYPNFVYGQWIMPAMTEDECLSHVFGRYGCQLPDAEDNLLWIIGNEECDCKGGILQNRWVWTNGLWKGGVPRSLEWKSAEKSSPYEYSPRLSFLRLSNWTASSAEEQFLYRLKSEIICNSQTLGTPMSALVCDCVADGGTSCYASSSADKIVFMGYTSVCNGAPNSLKDPSAQIEFFSYSVTSGCVIVNISIIYQNWFSAPYIPPPVSFQWQKHSSQGVVVNSAGFGVGELLGNGVVLTLSNPEVMGVLRVCLLLSTQLPQNSSFSVPDFGFPDSNFQQIQPLGLTSANISVLEINQATFWCVSLPFASLHPLGNTVTLFPIARVENYNDVSTPYVSTETEGLMYTLGVLYCITGFAFFIMLGYYVITTIQGERKSRSLSLPLRLSVIFVCLSVFRASFMFLYPLGTFEYKALAQFVVFEIPTFLLFTAVILAIHAWMLVTHFDIVRKGEGRNFTIVLALIFVWSLWIVVTVVYAEVILSNTSGYSPCVGRVQVSYSAQDEDTRTLTIIYQSIIIAVTFFLVCIFFYYTLRLFESAKRTSKSKQFVIVVGAVINVSFLVRCILFLILLSTSLVSSVYLFVTLMVTEVLPMIFLFVQFNHRRLTMLTSTTGTQRTSTSPSQSSPASVTYE